MTDVVIDNGGNPVIGFIPPLFPPVAPAAAISLTLGSGPGGSGTLTINQMHIPMEPIDLSVATNFVVGGTWDTKSVVQHNSGSVVVGDTLQLGRDSGADFVANKTQYYYFNGGSLQTQWGMVGGNGVGYFLQREGTSFLVNADLNLGQNKTAGGTLDKYGGDLQVTGSMYVGNDGTGYYFHGAVDPGGLHDGGTTTVNTDLVLGNNKDSIGSLTQLGGSITVNGYLSLGREGTGSFTQTGGTTWVGDHLALANEFGSHGTYTLSGGNLSAQVERIGNCETGEFIQTGGTNTVRADLNLGAESTGTGTYTLSDADGPAVLEVVWVERVGVHGAGIFNQSGGAHTARYLIVADNPGSQGAFNLSGGSLTVQEGATVGGCGIGDFIHTGGSVSVSGLGMGQSAVQVNYDADHNYIGYNLFQGNGAYTLNAPTVYDAGGDPLPNLSVTNEVVIGSGGTGAFNHQSGVHQIGGDLVIGLNADQSFTDDHGDFHPVTAYGDGTYNLSGSANKGDANYSALLVGGDLKIVVNDGAQGKFNQSGGSNTVNGSLYVGYDPIILGAEYNLSGTGQLVSKFATVVGNIGTGTFNQYDATSYHETPRLVLGSTSLGFGYYNLNDGALKVTTPAGDGTVTVGGDGTGYFYQSGGSLTSDIVIVGTSPDSYGLFDQAGGSHTINQIMTVGQDSTGDYWLYGAGYLKANAIDLGLRGAGSLYLSDSAELKVASHLTVGVADTDGLGNPIPGAGYFTQYGGTATVGFLEIGRRNLSYGEYNMIGGTMTADWMTLGSGEGDGGEGLVTVSNGASLTVKNNLVVGNGGGTGSLEMYDSWTSIQVDGDYILGQFGGAGAQGRGAVNQTGGATTVNGTLVVGGNSANPTGPNEYNLSGDGVVNAGGVNVADGTDARGVFRLSDSGQITTSINPIPGTSYTTSGNFEVGRGSGSDGQVYQSGGSVNTNNNYLMLARGAGSKGYYEMSGGSIDTGCLSVGFDGKGFFKMTGGTITAAYAEIGANNGSKGIFIQSGGSLQQINAGWSPSITLGREAGSQGKYVMKAGSGAPPELTATNLDVGVGGNGKFEQRAGSVTVNNILGLGYKNTGTGAYTITGGTLTVNDLQVGSYDYGSGESGNGAFTAGGGTVNAAMISVGTYAGTGTFIIDNPAAVVKVSESLTIGANATFSAVSGATIDMTGADNYFYNCSQTPANVDMTGLKMFYSNNGSFEVAGKDLGATMLGFTDNFALGTLELGAGVKLTLTDLFPNQGGAEVLYVYNLILGAGSILDPDPMNLYYVNLFNYGGVFSGVNPIQIPGAPLPGTLLLLGSGLMGLGVWRQFRG